MDQMPWPLSGPETISALIGLCGIVLPSVWARRDAAAKAEADKAVNAQTEAMANKDKEIAGQQRIAQEWAQRYEQERKEHRDDNNRNEDRIDHLEARLYGPKDRT